MFFKSHKVNFREGILSKLFQNVKTNVKVALKYILKFSVISNHSASRPLNGIKKKNFSLESFQTYVII